MSCFSAAAFAETEQFPKESVYQVTSAWKNQDKKEVRLSDFAKKPVVISMIYTGCEHACPLTITRLQEIESKAKSKNADYHIVLASFDPKNDTPDALKKYMGKRKLNPERWTLLTADDDETVRELAIILGVNYKKMGDKDFSHSNIFTLLDKQGVVKEKIEGLNADLSPIIKKLSTNAK